MEHADVDIREINYSPPKVIFIMCAVLCLMGTITGTVVFYRSYTDADIAAFLDAQSQLPIDFFGFFICELIENFAFFLLILLCSLFALGWLFVPVMLSGFGVGLGVSVCCFCAQNDFFGMLYAFAVILLPSLLRAIYLVALGNDAVYLSFGILRSLSCRGSGFLSVKKFVVKIPFCAVVECLASALSALMRIFLFRLIS